MTELNELYALRQNWLKAALIYYKAPGEDSGMSDYSWDGIGQILFAQKGKFPACPILNDPEYEGGSLYWVKTEVFLYALNLYFPGDTR